jgi:hypothetical protein
MKALALILAVVAYCVVTFSISSICLYGMSYFGGYLLRAVGFA